MKKFNLMTVLLVTLFPSLPTQANDTNFVVDAKDTALNGLFANLVGTDNYWPKLALTFQNFVGNDCANFKATIWKSENQKEVIPSFKICTDRKIGGAKLAYFNNIFEAQMDVMNNTGYQRTEGPIAPSRPRTEEFDGQILYELGQVTGWHDGQVDTNFWLVNDMK